MMESVTSVRPFDPQSCGSACLGPVEHICPRIPCGQLLHKSIALRIILFCRYKRRAHCNSNNSQACRYNSMSSARNLLTAFKLSLSIGYALPERAGFTFENMSIFKFRSETRVEQSDTSIELFRDPNYCQSIQPDAAQ